MTSIARTLLDLAEVVRAAFERDRVRDASLQLAGYRVSRVTHRRLEAEPAAVIAEARALLASVLPSSG